MKLLSYIVFLLQLMCLPAKAQTIANEKMNIVYRGVDNPISVAMFGYDCNDIELKTNKEKLVRIDCGKYIIRPKNIGQLFFTIYSIKDGIETVIDSIMFRSIEIPEPSMDSYKNRYFSTIELREETELSGKIMANNLDDSISVVSFEYLLLRDTIVIEAGVNESSKFKKGLLESIKKSQPGDVLFFDKIFAEDKERRLRRINSIRLKLEI